MSKRSSILLALPLAMFIVAGCGSDKVTAPVDTVPPVAVLDFQVTTATASGIELAWAPNTEADLAGYRVYRSIGNGDVTLVGVETAAAFRDGDVVAGNSYHYLVGAFDTQGNESARVSVWVALGSTGSGRVRYE
jgi:fibronectin type 3 domain-containing protein